MAFTPTEEAQLRQLLAKNPELLSLADNEATILAELGAQDVTLSDLAVATTISDSDVMLIRQGTDDKSIAGAVLKTFLTPPPVDIVSAVRDLRAGDIVMRGHTAIRTLDDGLPEGLVLNGDIVSLTTFPRLIRVWCGEATNGSVPAFYRCNASGGRDPAGTHIKLVDMRGYSPRAWDQGRGIDAGRILLSSQEDANKAHGHLLYESYTGTNNVGRGGPGSAGAGLAYYAATVQQPFSVASSGGSETCVKNIALMFMIYV